ncbi:polysaccharide deacetylase Ecf1 [Gammaproteobacteria bacterium]|nr:polysaccharide deacetylase Ecf1 [Gammaproteobacteria bacterium]
MYHSVAASAEYNGEKGINIVPEAFEKQVKYLKKRNYNFLKASELLSNSLNNSSNSSNSNHSNNLNVTLTFDDGYMNNYTNVFPILKKYNAKATIFLSFDAMNAEKLTPAQINEMQASGLVEFGAHTLTHCNITTLTDDQAELEIYASKIKVEELTQAACTSFAYPYGCFEDRHIAILKKLGFSSAFTVKKRILPLTDPFRIPRSSVINGIDLLQFHILVTRGKYRI